MEATVGHLCTGVQWPARHIWPARPLAYLLRPLPVMAGAHPAIMIPPSTVVAPSLAIHPFLAKVTSEDLLAELAGREAFGRAAEPWEVANVMVFLASDYSGYMTGEVVSVSAQHP